MRRTPRDTEATSRSVTRRALVMGGGMAAMVAALGARMRFLGVEQADEFRLLAEENRINIRLIPPARGLIQDRNGKLIAGNEQNYRVVITRENAGKTDEDVQQVLNRLSHIIPMTAEDLSDALKALKRNSAFVPITVADRVSWDDFSKIAVNAPALPGVTPEVGLSRVYPRDSDFAHIVGYVGPVSEKDLAGLENPDPLLRIPKFQIGKIGVEKWMEDTLRGSAGTKRIEVNAVGRVMRELDREEGVKGKDLRLTIDADVQNFVQARLGDESAACVVIEVNTGDIIAAVSSPSFDPNLFVRGISQTDYSTLTEHDHRPLANKVVQGAYPPGSTFKMVTALAALEAGAVDVNTSVRCPGYLEVGGRKFHCWKRGGHGKVDLQRSLAESCDVYFYDTAMKVGIDKIAEMGRKLGLGQRHDLPMSAITEGSMPDKAWKREKHKAEWVIGDTINASIGQGFVLTSPLQLAVMTARIASGKMVAPRIIHSINDQPVDIAPAESLGLEGSKLRAVQMGMFEVMNGANGTAKSSRIVDETMRMCGKTGTAQVRNISTAERDTGVVSNDRLPWKQRDHALFVGFAPADNPRYAVSVVVEHGGGGSTVAAPIARDALLRALTGTLPPLTAYPADQRGRMETLLNALQLRLPDGSQPAPSKV
ncbi:MAG: penicillin-binding protein 2 [Rhodobacteraceae bacterium]|uniref:penicillin-binding protein 2 n=1 Tax=Cypionkella sp. TaxID=2811411 RepID=UPI001320E8CA|nr:penicillin-binding protein 2 [Cypionkella sp.]KAF0174421.1 MAG: penicillin-binding protein 2 [Paracoccaceae bacterium]MDO8326532.1 penicillin-binding protein 2 [Cypionkella sp.]